jgi:exopolyphosphatase / guanosine-5'-triphosphate,3'-diphosphate pyrophosphatase
VTALDKRSKDAGANRRAVVDIGSNSVRLVIYDGPLRAPVAIVNEKALCGLGRDMTDEGMLNSKSVAQALTTLSRFRRLLGEYGAPPTHVIATAAVREAADSDAFVAAVRGLGFKVSVLSGEEEAGLAALGVVSFEPGATGIAGDMGGGSLELAALKNGATAQSISLPIGPLSIMQKVGDSRKDARKLIEKELDKVDFFTKKPYRTLYAVGGAWRAIGRIHMNLRRYPLSILHHYEMSVGQAFEICDLVSQQSQRSLETIPGIPRRRIDTLPFAAMALKSVLRRMDAVNVVVSAGGVREGILYRDLSKKERSEDPLLAACRFYAQRLSPDPQFGAAAAAVIMALFEAFTPNERRLANAACQLIDIGAYFHPDLRGRQAFDAALSAPFVGVSHQDRVWMALALYCRHEGRSSTLPYEQVISLLKWDDQQNAMQLGLAMRFVAAFAPKAHALLGGCTLERDGARVIFRAPADRKELMGEAPRKRLEALAASFEAEAVEIYET